MEEKQQDTQFSMVKRMRSFTHAWRGVWVYLKIAHNSWIHLTILAIAVFLGIYFHIQYFDWMLLAFAGGLVLMAEAFNTAIEIDMDLTSPEYHPFVHDTKDVAAGAVLIASITAAIIGIGIFGHYFLAILLSYAGH